MHLALAEKLLMDVSGEDIHPSVENAGMGIRNPVDSVRYAHRTSSHTTIVLVRSLIKKDPIDMRGHSCYVISTGARARRKRLAQEQDHINKIG